MHHIATPPRFNNTNSKARFLLTGFSITYKAHADKKKRIAVSRKLTKPIRNSHSEPVIPWAAAATSTDPTAVE